MKKLKTFEEYIHENHHPQKINIKFQDDEYYIIDKTFINIDFSKIPLKILRKQYINFKSIIKSPPTFGDPLMALSKKKRLNEGKDRKTFDIEDVKKTILKNYKLEEEQFVISTEENDIKVALIIPHIGDNEKLIIEDMESLGYYETIRGVVEIENMEYVLIRFDPRYPKDITDIIRKMKYIKHLTPKYNLESIKEHGFIPLYKNEIFKYPPRTHFIKENIDDKNLMFLGQQLCDYNSNEKNDGTYVLFILDVSRIPQNVKFVGDSCYEYGICTEDKIPFDTVLDIKEIKFRK